MGPSMIVDGKDFLVPVTHQVPNSFNGAVDDRRRKGPCCPREAAGGVLASMGPSMIVAGKPNMGSFLTPYVRLQWGRR